MPEDADGAARARSATEAFLYRRLDTLTEPVDASVSTWRCRSRSTASEPLKSTCCAPTRALPSNALDGGQHLADPAAYRRDRRKDQLLQENGYFVLRFLAEDVGKELDAVLDGILRVLARRRQSAARVEPLKFVRRGNDEIAYGLVGTRTSHRC
jgi:Protein of unknown function (DUF559)